MQLIKLIDIHLLSNKKNYISQQYDVVIWESTEDDIQVN